MFERAGAVNRSLPKLAALILLLAAWVGSGRANGADPPSRTVASDTGPILTETKIVAAVFAVVSALLGILLYVIPVRAVAATRRSLETTMTERALTLQEEDRRRIARDLHDGAGQALTAARLHLIALRDRHDGNEEAITQIMSHVDEAIDEVRRSTSALAPPALAELGLVGALERHCDTFARATRLTVHHELQAGLRPLHDYIETALYRITQEALHNAARHGGAKRVWVRLAADDKQARLEIGDDGCGFADGSRRGHGLDSIRERARLAGGSVDVIDDAGPGTRLRVTLPIDEPAA